MKQKLSTAGYGWFLLTIAGLGGLLYGIDVGIIAAALLYLTKTLHLTVTQTSIIVAAVLGGSMCSSLVAGALADWLGRKSMMIVSGLMFVLSVGLIVLSQGFVSLFLGRLLQGMSGGVIAVVVPLYLAECLSADKRGRGTAIFQFMLTLGIVIAAVIGWYYTRHAELAVMAAGGDTGLIAAAQNHAWRGMFLAVVYPGLIFFLGTFGLSESPRWLFAHGKPAAALTALHRASSEDESQRQLREMEMLGQQAARAGNDAGVLSGAGSLLQRKYVVPFILTCLILAVNQATGINSILGFLVVILKQAGMDAARATQGDVAVKLLNCVMTVVAIALVDRKGRKFLLKIGTAGIVIALAAVGLIFLNSESKRVDIRAKVQNEVRANALTFPVSDAASATANSTDASRRLNLTVLYSYGRGNRMLSVASDEKDPVLRVAPGKGEQSRPLIIKRALFGPAPAESTGWLITACLGLFMASYSVGPGVVVWLALSELMPTRIRSMGMGIALLLNQGVSTLIAAVFLPAVGNYGYYAVFFFWAACTVLYFVIAAFFLPETKGKTLEEIEQNFARGGPALPATAGE